MTTTLYYFTGTGNSLAAARQLARLLEKEEPNNSCTLVPIKEMVKQENIKVTGRVGFVFPLYYYGLPSIVEEFLEKADLSESSYIFTVITAMFPMGTALTRIKELLKKKGQTLQAGCYLHMPSNFIFKYEAPDEEGRNKLFTKARKKLEKIVKVIKKGKKGNTNDFIGTGLFLKREYTEWMARKKEWDNDMEIDDSCNGCGACSRVCPVGNIEIKEGKAAYLHSNCQQCLACVHRCPGRAIRAGEKSGTRRRYHHPEVSWKDIEAPGIQAGGHKQVHSAANTKGL